MQGLDEDVDGQKNVVAWSGKQERSGLVDGELVSIADRYLIDISVADIADAGGDGIIDHEWRRIRIGACEHVTALVRSVGQRHKLALNALQFIGDRGPVAVGERAIGSLNAEADTSLQRGYNRTQRRIGGRELALYRADTLQIAAVEGRLVVVLDQQGSGGRVFRGLGYPPARRKIQHGLLRFQLWLIECP